MSDSENHFESNFRDNVIAGISEVKAQNVMILARLDRINGSVQAVTQKANMLDIAMTAHPLNCTMREKIEKLSTAINSGDYPMSTEAGEKMSHLEKTVAEWISGTKAARATSHRWFTNLLPLLYVFIGGIVTMFLIHAGDLLRSGSLKP